jgi:hypothetical protein
MRSVGIGVYGIEDTLHFLPAERQRRAWSYFGRFQMYCRIFVDPLPDESCAEECLQSFRVSQNNDAGLISESLRTVSRLAFKIRATSWTV